VVPAVTRSVAFEKMAVVVVVLGALLSGSDDPVARDTQRLLAPRFLRSEVVGFVAGAGTTLAAMP
jgi:hypothetical protein